MNIERIIDRMKKHPCYLKMGSGKLSRRWGCTREDVYNAKTIIRGELLIKENRKKAPRILIFDLETSPIKAFVFGLWKQNISIDAICSEWFLLAYSYKWLGEDTIYSNVLTPEEVKEENDFRLIEELHEALEQADYVIAHNCKKFDVPRIKARFIVHGLTPTSYYQQIDTLEVAKKEFGFSSNKLDALARVFGFEGKKPTDFKLWVSCMNGDPVALKYMEEYNRQDIIVLEKVYLRMRPYIKSHPNWNLYSEDNSAVCPTCGSTHLMDYGNYFTQTSRYPTKKCINCGAISRVRKTTLSKEKELLLSIPGR